MEEALIHMPELLNYKVKLSHCNRTIVDATYNIRFLCPLLNGFREEVWEIVQNESLKDPLINIESLIRLRLRNITDKDLNKEMIKEVANEVRFRVLYQVITLKERCTVASFYKVFHQTLKEYFHALVK